MEKALYRNALRSRKLIQDAFMSLLLKKDVVDIKVREVIELANISKGTFYAHYDCLFDVQQELEDQQIARLFRVFEEQPPARLEDSFYPLFLSGLVLMKRDQELFRLLFRSSYGGPFLSKLKNTFLDCLLTCGGADSPVVGVDSTRGYLNYVAGGAIAIIQAWLESGADVPPEDVALFLNNCILEGLRGVSVGCESDIAAKNAVSPGLSPAVTAK